LKSSRSSYDHVDLNGNNKFLPEDVRPFPSAPSRKLGAKRSRLGKTRVLTDTPVKNEIALRQQQKVQKGHKNVEKKKKTPKSIEKVLMKKKKKKTGDLGQDLLYDLRKQLLNNLVPCLYKNRVGA